MTTREPVLRVATAGDEAAVDALMKESAAILFPRFYDERQAASAVRYVAQADPLLLADGTWGDVGVLGPEAFPAQPFLDKLAEDGSPPGVIELEP